MARKAALKDLVKPVESPEAFNEWVEKSDQILVLFDVHKKWCGRCEVMQPTFERLFLDNDEADKRVVFLSLDDSILDEEQRKALEPTLHDGCKPLFLVYKHKVVIGKVLGVNAPEIVTLVNENIFPIPEEE
mmetsp:Transcript_88616/g.214798  ORF Transcript_88616/g.214798 Transcript_88616/m.214798 type:complete len:131 (-) Transcript_88616:64-456(-)